MSIRARLRAGACPNSDTRISKLGRAALTRRTLEKFVMLKLPQNNGDCVSIPNRPDYRMIFEAFNFEAAYGDPQRIVMRRAGPDWIILAGADRVRGALSPAIISSLMSDMRLI